MLLHKSSFLLILCSLSLAEVSNKDVTQIEKELINLQNELRYIKESQLKNIENIVSEKVKEINNRNSTENAQMCVNKNGRRLLNEIEEKLDEATIGFIESCKNILNMIQKHEMNQVQLTQTERMLLNQDGLFKQQINHIISAVKDYVTKKITIFAQQISEECY